MHFDFLKNLNKEFRLWAWNIVYQFFGICTIVTMQGTHLALIPSSHHS